MKQQIAEIINDFYQSCGEAFEENVPAIAEVITWLVEKRPVSKIQAMAALIVPHKWAKGVFFVPGGDTQIYEVNQQDELLQCACNLSIGNCDHIKAVKLYLENQ